MSRAVVEAGTLAAGVVPPVSPSRLERLRPYRQAIGLSVSLLLFALALLACWHLLGSIDPGQVRAALAAVSSRALLLAGLASLAGVVVMIAYELSAARYAQVRLPWRTLALGGFCAFSIGNAVGFSVLSGGSVRYRLYGRSGLGAADVARMTLFASLSACAPANVPCRAAGAWSWAVLACASPGFGCPLPSCSSACWTWPWLLRCCTCCCRTPRRSSASR